MNPQQENSSSDVKPAADDDNINLSVTGQDGTIIRFRVKRQNKLEKMMVAYCQRQGLDINHIRFQLDGQRILKKQTPADLEMNDGDEIDVFSEQDGGIHCDALSKTNPHMI